MKEATLFDGGFLTNLNCAQSKLVSDEMSACCRLCQIMNSNKDQKVETHVEHSHASTYACRGILLVHVHTHSVDCDNQIRRLDFKSPYIIQWRACVHRWIKWHSSYLKPDVVSSQNLCPTNWYISCVYRTMASIKDQIEQNIKWLYNKNGEEYEIPGAFSEQCEECGMSFANLCLCRMAVPLSHVDLFP